MEKKEIEEKKPFKPKSGFWVLKDNRPMWQEVIGKKPHQKYEFHEPSELGLTKSYEFSVVIAKDVKTYETLSGTMRLYFIQHVKVKVREDQPHVWLVREGDKLFMKNLLGQTTGICPLRSNNWVLVEKTPFKRIELETLKELQNVRLVIAFTEYNEDQDLYGVGVHL